MGDDPIRQPIVVSGATDLYLFLLTSCRTPSEWCAVQVRDTPSATLQVRS